MKTSVDPHLLLLRDFAAIRIASTDFESAACYAFKFSGPTGDRRAFPSYERRSEPALAQIVGGNVRAAHVPLSTRV